MKIAFFALLITHFREATCCGAVFRGPFGEVMLDPRHYNPCSKHQKPPTSVNDKPVTSSTTIISNIPVNSTTPSVMASDANTCKTSLDTSSLWKSKTEDNRNSIIDPASEILSDKETCEIKTSTINNNNLLLASRTLVVEDPKSASKMEDGGLRDSESGASSVVSGATSFESLIESELKAFGLEAEKEAGK